MRGPIIIFCILLALSFGPACTNSGSKKIIDEGVIEYTISYDDSLKPNFNPNLLPSRFTIKFKKNNSLNKIEAMSGAVVLTFIKNYEQKDKIVLIKFLNKKLYFQEPLDNNDTLNIFSGMPEIILDSKYESVDYKGYKCSKVSATFDDSSNVPFDIIYTNEIKILHPNENTPFKNIDGIMLKFKIKLYNHLLSFRATSITSTSVSSDEFITPDKYEKVSRRTIDDIISLIQ